MEDAKLLSLHKKLKESAPKGRKVGWYLKSVFLCLKKLKSSFVQGGLGLGKRDDNLGFRISLPKDHPMYKKGAEDDKEENLNETPRTKRKRSTYQNSLLVSRSKRENVHVFLLSQFCTVILWKLEQKL